MIRVVNKNRDATRKDFRERYTEEEVREMFKEHYQILTESEIEEELDIIYHQPDSDLSLPVLYDRNKRYMESSSSHS